MTALDPTSGKAPSPHLLGLVPDELAAHLRSRGLKLSDSEARRLIAHRLVPDGRRHAERHPVSRALLEAARLHTREDRLGIVERVSDAADGFVKYLLRSPDGALSEAVRIPLDKPGHYSVCLSSQVGCAMACVFCATGRLGLTRNLEAWEMVAAFLAVRDEAPGRVSGAVFMGQGEPLHNYDEVMRAARVLSHPCGGQIAAKAISISTVGLVPQIRRYTAERQPYRLIVSLTSAVETRRRELLPVVGKTPLKELAEALRDHARASRTRLTIAWVLLGGVNSGEDEVLALQALLAGVPLRINLIDVNDARPGGYSRADDAERGAFMSRLQVLKTPVVRRYSGGSQRHAACGMLASTLCDSDEVTQF